MKNCAIVLGGILLGDTFRLNEWIDTRNVGEGATAICDTYNAGAGEVFWKDTDLPVTDLIVVEDIDRIKLHWDDVHAFVKHIQTKNILEDFDRIFYPTIEDIHHDLKRINYSRPDPMNEPTLYLKDYDALLPKKYIAVQSATHLGFKNISELYKVHFPLPVVNIGGPNDIHTIPGSIVFNGVPLRVAAYIISKAKLMVGIDSWTTQFAAQIGVPSCKIQFGDWEAGHGHRSVRELGGIDLLRTSVKEIEKAIQVMLEKNSDKIAEINGRIEGRIKVE